MAKHIVKCKYCNQEFDANTIPYVKISTRYAHQTCVENKENIMTQDEKDLEQLNNFIKELFGAKANWAMIKKQIKRYKDEEKYSYSGILKTLIYWYKVLNNPIEKSNGAIGIVPFVYSQAYDYWYNLYVAQSINEDKDISNYKKIKEVSIRIPTREAKKIKLFNLDD